MTRRDPITMLREAGVLSDLDVHFARAVSKLSPPQSEAALLGAALASRAVSHGHVCADLRELLKRPLVASDGAPVADVELPPIFEWVMALGQTTLVGDGAASTPLVFDGEARLYLRRYWTYQRDLADKLRTMAATPTVPAAQAQRIAEGVRRLFGASGSNTPDPRQMLAAAIAGLRRLAVISGGPGTGKTTTVVRVLALLVEEAIEADCPRPRIALLAPTGKAAARLSESISAGRDRLPCSDEVKASIPSDASTIHRRLGYRPGSPTRFAHDRTNPLPADVVLVDEASMVDLALMAKLFDAVPTGARVILLGDKDQLASVEAGAILGDICDTENRPQAGLAVYSSPLREQLREVLPELADVLAPRGPAAPGIWDSIALLTRSFRFSDTGGIGRLAKAIGVGDATGAIDQLTADDETVGLVDLDDPSALNSTLRAPLVRMFKGVAVGTSPEARLEALSKYRLLCAHRRGAFGTERLNIMIESALQGAGLIRREPGDPQYDGRPILVTTNDYQLDLFNGDVGIVHRDDDGILRAYFPDPAGGLRAFAASRLPPHESVYAMTVHKSQGSEFDEIGLLLPPQLSLVLTRELLYTAVTRAKERVTLFGTAKVIREAIGRRVDRASGLRDTLWAES